MFRGWRLFGMERSALHRKMKALDIGTDLQGGEKVMKIVICGGGLVGSAIASHLCEEQNALRLLMTQLRIFSGLQIVMFMVWLVLRLTLTGWRRLIERCWLLIAVKVG